jgi:hypothetical protein
VLAQLGIVVVLPALARDYFVVLDSAQPGWQLSDLRAALESQEHIRKSEGFPRLSAVLDAYEARFGNEGAVRDLMQWSAAVQRYSVLEPQAGASNS